MASQRAIIFAVAEPLTAALAFKASSVALFSRMRGCGPVGGGGAAAADDAPPRRDAATPAARTSGRRRRGRGQSMRDSKWTKRDPAV
jgi:hypothetical protein